MSIWEVIIGMAISIAVLAIKPEWFLGWLINLLTTKLPRMQANKALNALGVKMLEAGIMLVEKIPDDEESNQKVQKIKEITEELKKNFFSLTFKQQ